jgi:pimeloyl-ACP methyl ester carboxylesterase
MQIIEYNFTANRSILCIPGTFMSADSFKALAEYLPAYHFVCVTLDGFHPDSQDFDGLEGQTEKLVNLLTQRGFLHFDLAMGLSLGTIFALHLTKRQELTIDRLWLDGAVNLYRSPCPTLERRFFYSYFRSYLNFAKKKKRAIRSLKFVYTQEWAELMQLCCASMTTTSLTALSATLTDYILEAGIAQPMHFLYGGQEVNAFLSINTVKQCYPKAAIDKVRGYNHLMYLNRKPQEYAKRVETFLNSKPFS